MQVLLDPRVLASLAGLIGLVVSIAYPSLPQEKAVALVSSALTFLAGLYQPQPKHAAADDAKGASGSSAKP